MRDAIIEGDSNPKSVRDLFVRYGPDVTRWPKAKCPSCQNSVHPYGVKNVALQIVGHRDTGHRDPGVANPGFHHYAGRHSYPDGRECERARTDDPRFDELTKTTVDPKVAQAARAEFFSYNSLRRARAVLRHVLSRNYSEGMFKKLVGIMDQKNIWSWNFPNWSAPYIMLQQTEFDYRFGNGNTHRIRFLPGTEGERKVLRMVFAGSSKALDFYKPYEVSEQAANAALKRMEGSPQTKQISLFPVPNRFVGAGMPPKHRYPVIPPPKGPR